MSSHELPELLNIQLSAADQKDLYGRLERCAAADLATPRNALTRVDVFEWAAREVLEPDCGHLEDYHFDTGDRTICLRCDGDDGRPSRDVEREAAAGAG